MLASRVDGSGSPIVLLNGGLMTIASWDAIAAGLMDAFRVIRCDFRGQLLSQGPYPSTLDEHAADVIELLDSLAVDSAHIAGTSFGAEVAIALAAAHPARVRTLIVATAVERNTDEMREGARRLRLAAEGAARGGDGGELFRLMVPTTFSRSWLERQPPEFVETRARQVGSLPPQFFAGAAAILRVVEQFDVTPYFASIEAPTLVIGAEHDSLFPLVHSRAIAEGIHGARLEIIRDSGHAAVVEQPARFTELLRDFAAAWRTGAPACPPAP